MATGTPSTPPSLPLSMFKVGKGMNRECNGQESGGLECLALFINQDTGGEATEASRQESLLSAGSLPAETASVGLVSQALDAGRREPILEQ